jgi:SAM-dependent MidA family methyltransferase
LYIRFEQLFNYYFTMTSINAQPIQKFGSSLWAMEPSAGPHGIAIEVLQSINVKSMRLEELVIHKIHQQGPLSFHDFMEMALYHPEQGYYTAARDKIGEGGDFYTSPYLSELFGQMIAVQLEEMWKILGQGDFTIVECGAGAGMLCRDILRSLERNRELFDHLRYVIIEKSVWLREKEKAFLGAEGFLPKMKWVDSLRDLSDIHGCILSNELIDNFAVHQVVMCEQLMEVFVTYEDGFVERLEPASPNLRSYLEEFGISLAKGSRAEINLEATQWIREAAAALSSGFVLTIDYGHAAVDLYSRRTGTLACYHKHQVSFCPYDSIGEQDITSHVNFSALDHWGSRSGLEFCGYTNQTRFLQGLGLISRIHELGVTSPQLRTLLDMGTKFKVLIQRKNLPRVLLSGLQFAQNLI